MTALTALALLACAPPVCPADGGCACGSAAGAVEVGAGGSRFRSLAEGDPLTIVRGAQGGIHVVVGARLTGVAPDGLELRYALEDADGGPVGTETRLALDRSLLDPLPGGGWERHPDLVVLNGAMPDVEGFAGRTVVLRAEAETPDGTRACDARPVVLMAPDG